MKTTVWLALFLLISQTGFSQKRTVQNVTQDYCSIVRFDRIETDERQTVADVTLQRVPEWPLTVSSQSFLQRPGSDRRYRLIRAEGIPLDSAYRMPASGLTTARLHFEPIGREIGTVDFYNPNENNASQDALGIRATERLPLPDALRGNWLATDGSNRWIYGLWDRFAICDGKFWNYRSIDIRGNSARIELQNDTATIMLYVKAAKGGTLLAGRGGEPLEKLGREPMRTPSDAGSKYVPKTDPYRNALLGKPGAAVIRGYIDGYNQRLNNATLLFFVDDDMKSGGNTLQAADILPDGRFEVSVPLDHPQSIYCHMDRPNTNFRFFAMPGDTLMTYVDLKEIADGRYTTNSYFEHCAKHRYMGGQAEYNYYKFLADKSVPNPQTNEIYMRTKEAAGRNDDLGFKAFAMERIGQARDSLLALFGRYRIPERTKDCLFQTIMLAQHTPLLEYEMQKMFTRSTAHQDSNGRWIVVKNENYRPLDSTYNDYLTMEIMDNPFLVAMPNLTVYLNRIEYGGVSGVYVSDQDLAGCILKLRKDLPAPERDSLKALSAHGTMSQTDNPARYLIDSCKQTRFGPTMIQLRAHGLDRNLSTDFAIARELHNSVNRMQKQGTVPSDTVQTMISEALPYIKTPYVAARLLDLYASVARPDGPAENGEKPKGERILDSLLAPYRGDVLFVDFWGLGCGPCRQGMVEAKPIVSRLAGHRIKFVYIAQESSVPQEATDRFIRENGLQGEFLRVSGDQWNHMAARFGISGIPHTMIVDKQGKIIRHGHEKLNEKELLRLEAEP